MMRRVARLFDEQASLDAARSGDFYGMLPYAEYAGTIDRPDTEQWLDALAVGVMSASDSGAYADAQHFFDHVLPTGSALTARLSPKLLSAWVDRLLDEPHEDGGWPTPYDQAWRPWSTAMGMVTLARLRDGV